MHMYMHMYIHACARCPHLEEHDGHDEREHCHCEESGLRTKNTAAVTNSHKTATRRGRSQRNQVSAGRLGGNGAASARELGVRCVRISSRAQNQRAKQQ